MKNYGCNKLKDFGLGWIKSSLVWREISRCKLKPKGIHTGNQTLNLTVKKINEWNDSLKGWRIALSLDILTSFLFVFLLFSFLPLEIITNSETPQSLSCRRPGDTLVISLLALQFLALLISLLRQVSKVIRAGWKLPVMLCSQPTKKKTVFNPSFVFDYRKMTVCLESALQGTKAVKMLLPRHPELGPMSGAGHASHLSWFHLGWGWISC